MRTPAFRRVSAFAFATLALSAIAVTASPAVRAQTQTEPEKPQQQDPPPPPVVPPAPVQLPALPRFQPEGRATAPVPGGGGVQVGTPTPDVPSGLIYEKRRIKRTVMLEPAALDGRWDILYLAADTTGSRVAYFDWDSEYLYFAWESVAPEPIRFDIDGKGDGWIRGADNLSIQLTMPEGAGDAAAAMVTPQIFLQRFDASGNRDRPEAARSPIPAADMKAVAGRTPRGTFVAMLAVPRSELLGLPRKPDVTFGLRVEPGLLPAPTEGTTVLSTKPMLRLTLADTVEANDRDLNVSLKIPGRRDLTAGNGLSAVLSVQNRGTEPVAFSRLFLRGSQNAVTVVDAASFTGTTLRPGEKITRELKSGVSTDTPIGSLVLTGGVEWPQGGAAAALASFDRVEPYSLTMDIDSRPVITAVAGTQDPMREVVVTARSRMNERMKGTVILLLPAGWTLQEGELSRPVELRADGHIAPHRFKVLIPASTAPGDYPLEAAVELAGKKYTARGVITVNPADAGTK